MSTSGHSQLRQRSGKSRNSHNLAEDIESLLEKLIQTGKEGSSNGFSTTQATINKQMDLLQRQIEVEAEQGSNKPLDRHVTSKDYAQLEARYATVTAEARRALAQARQQHARQALLGQAEPLASTEQDVIAKLKSTRDGMAQHVSAGAETASSIAAANNALADIKDTLTTVTGSSGQGLRLSKRLQQEDTLNRRFIFGGFACFLLTIAYLLWKHAGMFSLVFGTVIAAILAAYVVLYLTCFARK
eukprot:m.236061 g.236061  ORF g.236061 m.236061 type:complete len:244 (-) comp17411_c0_seq3:377-1108(-)